MNIKTLTVFASLLFSSQVYSQNKPKILDPSIYDSLPKPPSTQIGKYDHLPEYEKQRMLEIEKNNAKILEYDPHKYEKERKNLNVIVDPATGLAINPANPSVNTRNINGYNNYGQQPIYRNSFMAVRHRTLSDLVNNWSGKEDQQYLFWSYSKDYVIHNPHQFNKESKLNEATGLDDALQKVFKFIALKEINNPSHLPPKLCYEGNTIFIVDNNVDC